MGYIILAFRSRNQTAIMFDVFIKNGLPCKIVNTPKEANVGCGVSLKIDESYLDKAKRLVSLYPQNTYIGFFRVRLMGGKILVKRIC